MGAQRHSLRTLWTECHLLPSGVCQLDTEARREGGSFSISKLISQYKLPINKHLHLLSPEQLAVKKSTLCCNVLLFGEIPKFPRNISPLTPGSKSKFKKTPAEAVFLLTYFSIREINFIMVLGWLYLRFGFVIGFIGLSDTARDYTLHFTITYTHTLVSPVTASLPLLDCGFKWWMFPFLWVPELSLASARNFSQQ
jgi:hypothetical protein